MFLLAFLPDPWKNSVMIFPQRNDQNDVMLKLLDEIPQHALIFLAEDRASEFWKVLNNLEAHWTEMLEKKDLFLPGDGLPVDPSVDEVHSSHWMVYVYRDAINAAFEDSEGDVEELIQSPIEEFVPGEEDANAMDREDIFFVTDHHMPRYFQDRANADDATDSVSDRVITTGA